MTQTVALVGQLAAAVISSCFYSNYAYSESTGAI